MSEIRYSASIDADCADVSVVVTAIEEVPNAHESSISASRAFLAKHVIWNGILHSTRCKSKIGAGWRVYF